MIQWIRDWQQFRKERKIIRALIEASLQQDQCWSCEDDCEQCICSEQDCD